MSDVLGKLVAVIGVAIVAMIVFVRAGQYGGATGGEQTAQIFYAAGGGLGNFVSKAGGGPG